MSVDRWSRLKDLFGHARELPGGERNAFLASCEAGEDTRRELASLLPPTKRTA